jgi:beta-carotene hydroxylase
MMPMRAEPQVRLPSIHELGEDLLTVSAAQRALIIARPFLACLGYWGFAALGWWPLALASLAAMMFLTYASSSHDYVHRTLHLTRAANEPLLAITELLGLRSGHAFRMTHLHHHRRFPHADDIEAYAAAQGMWRALGSGPGHQIRLFLWAWPRATPAERVWMTTEAAAIVAMLATAVVITPVAVYAGLVLVSGWFYPLATVWWPHRSSGTSALEHTRAFRGRIVPALFLQHTYHLEHHLYPAVASVNWRHLAHRLDPHLAAAGVEPVWLP